MRSIMNEERERQNKKDIRTSSETMSLKIFDVTMI
jgi:hypothetical protein